MQKIDFESKGVALCLGAVLRLNKAFIASNSADAQQALLKSAASALDYTMPMTALQEVLRTTAPADHIAALVAGREHIALIPAMAWPPMKEWPKGLPIEHKNGLIALRGFLRGGKGEGDSLSQLLLWLEPVWAQNPELAKEAHG